MPFTNELDAVYEACYKPVIESNGLKPLVLTKEHDGTPVYSQIITNIQNAYLVIADLTIARPNCYFEVGYAIGQGKQDSLIMSCREDHIADNPQNPRQSDKALLLFNLIKGFLPVTLQEKVQFYFSPILDQHKIHFDLSGYNILWWNSSRKEDFIARLDAEIKKRIQILNGNVQNIGQTQQQTSAQAPPQGGKMSDQEKKKKFDQIAQDQERELKNVKI